MKARQQISGMTLVELMIVLIIVSVLASITIPAYRGFIIRAKRAEAKAALLQTAAALERCFTRNNSYSRNCGVALPFNTENYQIVAGNRTDRTFSLQAVPQGAQAKDDCMSLILDNNNKKTVSESSPKNSQDCWGK